MAMNETLGLIGGNSNNPQQGRQFVNMQFTTQMLVPFKHLKSMLESGKIYGEPIKMVDRPILVPLYQNGELIGKEIHIPYMYEGIKAFKRLTCSEEVLELSKAELPNLYLKQKKDNQDPKRLVWTVGRVVSTGVESDLSDDDFE